MSNPDECAQDAECTTETQKFEPGLPAADDQPDLAPLHEPAAEAPPAPEETV